MKVGDLVRRTNLPQRSFGWGIKPSTGVVIAELKERPGEVYRERLFRVFWGTGYGIFVMSESKLELLNESR